MSRAQPIAAGSRFERWTVTGPAGRIRHNLASQCVCECGASRVIKDSALRSGVTRSCGCLANEEAAARMRARTTHGLSKTPEYRIWRGMKSRCFNERQTEYPRYGGKGITVCERWLKFENFIADMGSRPSPAHSIDRIDGSKDYAPENCRWATDVEQNNNRKGNVLIECHGKVQTVAQWSRETGLSWATIRQRLQAGWPAERVLEAQP